MISHTFNSLTSVNIELTSRCNKDCWMCGRRRIDRDYPGIALDYGDMEFSLVEKIADQLPENIVVQLHNNGEALLYPKFGQAVGLFKKQITNIVTNGKLLLQKADEVIDNLDTLAISVIENDPEGNAQLEIISEFLKLKNVRSPYTILRLNGNIDVKRYKKFNIPIATRVIHSALGSFNYKKDPTIPEIGICLDLLNHLAINRKGLASICVRFDPKGIGVIGDVHRELLADIWNSPKRLGWIEKHKKGKRSDVPLCSYCHFWGVPTGNNQVNNCEIAEKVFTIKQK